MNASLANNVTDCPDFVANVHNITTPYCAVPLCANATAVMAQCCAGAQVFPYHSGGGPKSEPGPENMTDMNALWCHIDNSSASTYTFDAWGKCVGRAIGLGLCSDPSTTHTSGTHRSVTTGMKKTAELAAILALLFSML